MPSNSEVQYHLSLIVSERARSGLELDRNAQNRVGELIATAAETMERDNRLDDPEALAQAEEALRRLLLGAFREAGKGQIERRGASFIRQPPPIVKEAAVNNALRGICPLWPIC